MTVIALRDSPCLYCPYYAIQCLSRHLTPMGHSHYQFTGNVRESSLVDYLNISKTIIIKKLSWASRALGTPSSGVVRMSEPSQGSQKCAYAPSSQQDLFA